MVVFLIPLGAVPARQQEPATAPPAAPASQPAPTSPSKSGKAKYSHANDFLIRGTVFTDKALSFPCAQLRIRRAGEKKLRWESYTNSRGEFAVRAPQGANDEKVIRANRVAEQPRNLAATARGNAR